MKEYQNLEESSRIGFLNKQRKNLFHRKFYSEARKSLLKLFQRRDIITNMINEKVLLFLKEKGYADRLTEHKETIDTVEHAAQQIGCSEAEIAKTLSFIVEGKPVIVVMAGDGRVNSSKFKALFHTKPSMIQREQVEAITGFAPGGVCPFNVPKEIPVWLDVSMKRFEYVHPAGGNSYTSVKLTPAELEEVTNAAGWCDVCKGWEQE